MYSLIELDNIIETNMQDAIEQVITTTSFPWFYSNGTIDPKTIDPKFILEQGINPQQFVHNVIIDSQVNTMFFNLIEPILNKISEHLKKDIEVKKAKFNFLPNTSNDTHHYPHCDISVEDSDMGLMKTMIYYVNVSDGPTYLFDEFGPTTNTSASVINKINPKKGKAIIFNSNQFHSSSSPIKYKNRIVLNVVFKIVN